MSGEKHNCLPEILRFFASFSAKRMSMAAATFAIGPAQTCWLPRSSARSLSSLGDTQSVSFRFGNGKYFRHRSIPTCQTAEASSASYAGADLSRLASRADDLTFHFGKRGLTAESPRYGLATGKCAASKKAGPGARTKPAITQKLYSLHHTLLLHLSQRCVLGRRSLNCR